MVPTCHSHRLVYAPVVGVLWSKVVLRVRAMVVVVVPIAVLLLFLIRRSTIVVIAVSRTWHFAGILVLKIRGWW